MSAIVELQALHRVEKGFLIIPAYNEGKWFLDTLNFIKRSMEAVEAAGGGFMLVRNFFLSLS